MTVVFILLFALIIKKHYLILNLLILNCINNDTINCNKILNWNMLIRPCPT